MGEPNHKIGVILRALDGLEQRNADRAALRKLHRAETAERRRAGNLRPYNLYTTSSKPQTLAELRSAVKIPPQKITNPSKV